MSYQRGRKGPAGQGANNNRVERAFEARKPWPKCRFCHADLLLSHVRLGFCDAEHEARYYAEHPELVKFR